MVIFEPKMGKWSKKTQKWPFLKEKKKYNFWVIFGNIFGPTLGKLPFWAKKRKME